MTYRADLPLKICWCDGLKLTGSAGAAFSDLDFIDTVGEDCPNAVNPVEMLWLHQDGAQACDGVAVAADGRRQRAKKEGGGQFGDGEMQAAVGSGDEDGA